MPRVNELSIEYDVPVVMRDGTVLRANVFRPPGDGQFPVILTHGPYGKDIHFADFNSAAYDLVDERGAFMNWETVNPAWWVPHGYAVVRVDQRGTGTSVGRMQLLSPQEFSDFYDCIEWAGTQSWSSGKVGLLGVSYYATGQWHVAALRPPHLAAIIPWEGACDLYRDWSHHGGILSNAFTDGWWKRQITSNQSALPEAADNPERAVGGNADLSAEFHKHAIIDEYFAERVPDLGAIDVPLLSCGSWANTALHLRGNIEGFLAAGSEQKWLEIHTGNHFTPFYSEEGRRYQKSFFDRFLLGHESAWPDDTPAVRLLIRTKDGGKWREEPEWPLVGTAWTPYFLDASDGYLSVTEHASASSFSYANTDDGINFVTPPFVEDTEITGPISLNVWVSTNAADLDLFATLIDIAPDGTEVTFPDPINNPGPVTRGWLRASHRALDTRLTRPWRPYHPHDRVDEVPRNTPLEMAVEIGPTSLVFERGHRLCLILRPRDRVEPNEFRHDDPVDRDPGRFAGTTTIHCGADHPSRLLLPIIPSTNRKWTP